MYVTDIAQTLRLHPVTVRRLLRSGKLKGTFHSSGKSGYWTVTKRELNAYLKEVPQCTCSFYKGREYGIYSRLHAPTCPMFKKTK
jgi:hypothetical protein